MGCNQRLGVEATNCPSGSPAALDAKIRGFALSAPQPVPPIPWMREAQDPLSQ